MVALLEALKTIFLILDCYNGLVIVFLENEKRKGDKNVVSG